MAVVFALCGCGFNDWRDNGRWQVVATSHEDAKIIRIDTRTGKAWSSCFSNSLVGWCELPEMSAPAENSGWTAAKEARLQELRAKFGKK